MKYSGGASLRDLAGFRLMRAEGDGSLTDLAELPVTDQERFQKVRRFAYVDTSAPAVRKSLAEKKEITPEIDGQLRQALTDFKGKWK